MRHHDSVDMISINEYKRKGCRNISDPRNDQATSSKVRLLHSLFTIVSMMMMTMMIGESELRYYTQGTFTSADQDIARKNE